MRPPSPSFARRALRSAAFALLALLGSPPDYAGSRAVSDGLAPRARSSPPGADPVKLVPPKPEEGSSFGGSVELDGDRAAVADDGAEQDGLHNSGAVYLYERDAGGPGAWGQVARVHQEEPHIDDSFGGDVALDGDRMVVGAIGDSPLPLPTGAAYIFERDAGGSWSQIIKLTDAGGRVFDYFGRTVAIDGDTVAVSNERRSVFVYGRDVGGPGAWGLVTELRWPDPGGVLSLYLPLAVDGATIAVGEAALFGAAGAVYMFDRDRGGPDNWGLAAVLTAPDPTEGFGAGVDLDGDRAVVGDDSADPDHADRGQVYVYERDAGDPASWHLVARTSPAELLAKEGFAANLALDADLAVAGIPVEGAGRGSARVFKRSAGGDDAWGEGAVLTAPDGAPGRAGLGSDVAISGSTVLVGNPGEEPRGSAYIFELKTLGPYLKVSGACPGPVRIEIRAAGPDRPVTIAGSFAEGADVVPGGRCAGTEVGLDSPRLLGTSRTDTLGNLALDLDLNEAACGVFVQALALDGCLTSDVDRLPQPRSVARYDAGRPADFFRISSNAYAYVGNVFDTAHGSPLAGGSLSVLQMYMRGGVCGGNPFRRSVAVFPYPASPDAQVSALEILAPPDDPLPEPTFLTYVLANPISVPARFMVGQLLYKDQTAYHCYSAGEMGARNDTLFGQGHHGFEVRYVDPGFGNRFRRLDYNLMMRVRGGLGDPALPVELMKPRSHEIPEAPARSAPAMPGAG